MHRKPFIQLLEAYASRHPEESDCTTRYLDFVQSNPECFERFLAPGHVTASTWILNQSGTAVLLTHHRKLNRWLQPGGHVDGDPDALRSAMREAREESGLTSLAPVTPAIFDLDIHPIPARRDEPEHLHYDARFLLRAAGDEAFVVSEESHDLAWVPLARLTDHTDEPSILRMAAKTPAP